MAASFAPLTAALAAVALVLTGCGGGGGPSPSPTPKPTPQPGPSPPPTPGPHPGPSPAPPAPPGPVRPVRGVAYVPKPCSTDDVTSGGACSSMHPGQDYMQEGYAPLWGSDGRDDLGTVQRLGGNAVRLYASMGLDARHDHGKFLDRAHELGLHVMPGFYTQMACPDFDCFDSWKAATLAALNNGFKKDGAWHPAVSVIFIQDSPDALNFGGTPPPTCTAGLEAKCRVKAAVSALDGVLAAERQAGIKTTANLSIAWSFDTKDSIDGVIKQGVGIYGFQDMVAGTKDPSIANYVPTSEKKQLQEAVEKRWVHSTNTNSPWSFVQSKVGDNYARFLPTPWMLSEFRLDGKPGQDLANDLKALEAEAKKAGSPFMGASVYTFQNDYMNPTPQLYGLFGLGADKQGSGKTGEVCETDVNTKKERCGEWTVYCVNATASYLGRGAGVASAWGGSLTSKGSCPSHVSARVDLVV